MASRSPQQIVQERESILCSLEARAEELINNGACSTWLNEADPDIKIISYSLNGPLLEELASATHYHVFECINIFRLVARVLGLLSVSGNGKLIDTSPYDLIQALRASTLERNLALLGALKKDTYAAQLLELSKADARLYRMTPPRQLHRMGGHWNLAECIIAARFGLQRGLNADGSPKVKAVDNETEAGVNPCCGVSKKLSMDGIDALVKLLGRFQLAFGALPHFWKADIDASFQRLPLLPVAGWAANVAFAVGSHVYVAGHLTITMPFGATAFVHA